MDDFTTALDAAVKALESAHDDYVAAQVAFGAAQATADSAKDAYANAATQRDAAKTAVKAVLDQA